MFWNFGPLPVNEREECPPKKGVDHGREALSPQNILGTLPISLPLPVSPFPQAPGNQERGMVRRQDIKPPATDKGT